jgi:Cns1/TTC4 Wheel domain
VHEALDVCYRGLKIDDSNTALKTLLKRIQAKADVMERIDRKRRAEEKRRKDEERMLQTTLATRKVQVRGTAKPPDLEDAQIRLSPNPLSPTSLLEFPVMLLYPTHHQTDFIKAFAEKDWLSHHLSYILPLPWDSEREFTMDSVDCYMDTVSGGLMKVGKKIKLLDILSNGKTEVVDGLVRIYVVPKARAGEWIADVKKQQGR